MIEAFSRLDVYPSVQSLRGQWHSCHDFSRHGDLASSRLQSLETDKYPWALPARSHFPTAVAILESVYEMEATPSGSVVVLKGHNHDIYRGLRIRTLQWATLTTEIFRDWKKNVRWMQRSLLPISHVNAHLTYFKRWPRNRFSVNQCLL